MVRLSRVARALVVAGLFAGGLAADELTKLREKLAQESNPADRAKITVEIGEELLKQANKVYKDGAYTDGEMRLDEYRHAVRAAYQGLVESGRDARRKPSGFKELEIHLRKSRRQLQDLAQALPYDTREPVEETLADLEGMRLELLDALMNVDRDPQTQKEKQP
ncbi:MAG: hypothetical protein HY656_00175 [Acidobacteria bacterium]|nr:hypothetical protein [Acidobacteriota bacterium]